jgi:hypothetical protein
MQKNSRELEGDEKLMKIFDSGFKAHFLKYKNFSL